MTKQKYIDAQTAWLAMTGLKVGSKVTIIRKAQSYEYGWPNSWSGSMVGSGTYTISGIHDSGVAFKEIGYGYPFFILEPVVVKLPDPIELDSKDL